MSENRPHLYELSALAQRQAELIEQIADTSTDSWLDINLQATAIGALLSAVGLLFVENSIMADLLLSSSKFDEDDSATLNGISEFSTRMGKQLSDHSKIFLPSLAE